MQKFDLQSFFTSQEKIGPFISPLTNSYEKKSTAEMLLILTILNVISKQNTTNRVDKNDLV